MLVRNDIKDRKLIAASRVIARTTATVTAPSPDRKFDGIFTIITELSPMATPSFEPGRLDSTILLSFPISFCTEELTQIHRPIYPSLSSPRSLDPPLFSPQY